MTERPRVAVFLGGGALQSQTANVIRMLAARAYGVDIFLFQVSQRFENLRDLVDTDAIRVINFSSELAHSLQANGWLGQRSFKQIFKDKLQRWPHIYRYLLWIRSVQFSATESLQYWFHVNDIHFLLPRALLDQTLAYMSTVRYRCLIGVEPLGLVWAGVLAQQLGVPSIYYSLELYTNDFLTNGYLELDEHWFRRLKRMERRYHRAADATIIQDAERAQVLLHDNTVEQSRCFFVPVSLLGPPITEKTKYLRRVLNIPDNRRIILAFGLMTDRRFTPDLIGLAQSFPEDWVLVVHGYPSTGDVLRELRSRNTANRAIISTELVPPTQINDLVASADIGLVFYSRETQNEYLTGRSSEKAALNARAGVPMVAFNFPSFVKIFSQYQCGRWVSNLAELKDQIQIILNDYETYRQGTFHAYADVYEFSRHFCRVLDWIDKLQCN